MGRKSAMFVAGAITAGVAIGLVSVRLTATAQEPRRAGGASHASHAKSMDACAEACNACQRACDSCATHCAKLLEGGKAEHLKTLQSCLDCADMCSTAARSVSRGGPFATLICNACVETCAECAKLCEKYSNDEHMKRCAAECRACEKACRDMLTHIFTGNDKPKS